MTHAEAGRLGGLAGRGKGKSSLDKKQSFMKEKFKRSAAFRKSEAKVMGMKKISKSEYKDVLSHDEDSKNYRKIRVPKNYKSKK